MDELTKYLQTSEKYDEQELIEILNKKIIITSDHIKNIRFHHINVLLNMDMDIDSTITMNCGPFFYGPIYINNINIIKIFEKYGYTISLDDAIFLIKLNYRYIFLIQTENIFGCNFKNSLTMNEMLNITFVIDEYNITEIYKLIIEQDPAILEIIPENKKTIEIYRIAVTCDGLALKYISDENQTNEICKIAVQQNGTAIQYIPYYKITERICEYAVRQNSYAVYFIPRIRISYKILQIITEQTKDNILLQITNKHYHFNRRMEYMHVIIVVGIPILIMLIILIKTVFK